MVAVNVHVCVRIRPLNKGEKRRRCKKAISVTESSAPSYQPTESSSPLSLSPSKASNPSPLIINVQLPQSLLPTISQSQSQLQREILNYKQFHPNNSFVSTPQATVFADSNLPLLCQRAMEGYRTTFFAYGQTGAGKTYTTLGDEASIIRQGYRQSESDGLLPRAISYLFKLSANNYNGNNYAVKKYTIRMSVMEIYNEQCFDLLRKSESMGGGKALLVREHKTEGFYVDNLMGVRCPTERAALQTAADAIRARKSGSHEMNERSSRSHLMVTLYIDGVTLVSEGERVVVVRASQININ